ncbi:MAG: ATP-binding protein [Thermoanaerobaculia bacterium]|jgi:PAS domain S-box-containing protein
MNLRDSESDRHDPGPARLFVVDAPAGARASLAALWDGETVEVGEGWDPRALGDPPPAPLDAVLLWFSDPERIELSRVNALHANYPRVPLLARVPRGAGTIEPLLLSAGVQEIIHRPHDLPRSLALARGRVELLTEAVRGSGSERTGSHSYEGLFPNLYDWIYVVGVAEDGGLSFETVNPPLHTTGDFLNPDYVGRAPEACLHPESARLMRSHIERVLAEGCPLQFEEEQPSAAGGTRSFQTILTPVRNKWGRIHRIAGISRDTTVLREAQAALRASEERLAHALEGTQQGLWDWDVVRGTVYRSPRWFEMLGLAPDDVEGTLDAGFAKIHPDDRDGVERAIRLHVEGHSPRFQAEYRILTGSGDWLWLFDAGKVVSWTEDGRPARIAGLCTDITDRRRAEESLRALVGGVVHEMRNPAFGIGVNLDALEATFGDEPRYRPFVAALRDSCNRILSLMNDLRDYGEPRTLRAEPCRVRTLVDEAARSCAALSSERGCRLVVEFEDDNLVLPLHAFRLQQVFRNLIENALFHAPAGSVVSVAGRTEQVDRQAWSVFTVEDRGSGFDPEALARAFEPFFTRRRGGTGLGLSIVRRVVEEHGGSVTAANRQGGGALLTLRLPMPRAHAAALEVIHA